MIYPVIQEKTIHIAQFDIVEPEQLQDLYNNYTAILTQACKQQGLEKDNTYNTRSAYIQPTYGVNAKGEPTSFINVMSTDYVTDSWITHHRMELPVRVTVNLEDWSDITLASLSENIILEPRIVKNNDTIDKRVLFCIENIEQGKELAHNFDLYMEAVTTITPRITGFETLDTNGNTVKDVTLCVNNNNLEKVISDREGNVKERSTIQLPAYISINFYNWNDFYYWRDEKN